MTEQLEGDIKMKELDLESFYKEYGIPVNYQFRHNTVSYLIIAVLKKYSTTFTINDKCIGCLKCVRSLGCPAIVRDGKRVLIDAGLCTGCSLCAQICPVNAIKPKIS